MEEAARKWRQRLCWLFCYRESGSFYLSRFATTAWNKTTLFLLRSFECSGWYVLLRDFGTMADSRSRPFKENISPWIAPSTHIVDPISDSKIEWQFRPSEDR